VDPIERLGELFGTDHDEVRVPAGSIMRATRAAPASVLSG
jgi:hypothetical protein